MVKEASILIAENNDEAAEIIIAYLQRDGYLTHHALLIKNKLGGHSC